MFSTSDREHNQRYGWPHRRARAAALAALTDGDPCARCRRPMHRGQTLHLDHAPGGGYLGLSHGVCNVRVGGRVGNAVRRSRRTTAALRPRTTRDWDAPPPPDPRLPVW